jgi:hypothetical protein
MSVSSFFTFLMLQKSFVTLIKPSSFCPDFPVVQKQFENKTNQEEDTKYHHNQLDILTWTVFISFFSSKQGHGRWWHHSITSLH